MKGNTALIFALHPCDPLGAMHHLFGGEGVEPARGRKKKDASKFYGTKAGKAKQKKNNNPLKSFAFRRKKR